MQFRSSRNSRHTATLSQAIVRGLAPDGGLFVPERLPALTPPAELAEDLPALAARLLETFFAGDRLHEELPAIAREAFSFPAPLRPLKTGAERLDALELFHGPTAAFKDFGARFLAACMQRLRAGAQRPLTILTATSGDTGAAVAAAFHRRPWAEVFVLFPKGLISARQQQQLTCWDGNVHSLAVRSTFDACQRLVKEAFLDTEIAGARELSSANSINLGRLLPQLVYYAAASLRIEQRTGRRASFIVPSGNLGNVVACIWAREMGLPVQDIILAHNANRTVPDYVETGRWQPRPSQPTLASAMDVGDPSNMERLRMLYPQAQSFRDHLRAFSVDDEQIRLRIQRDYLEYGQVWCPHSAVAAQVYAQLTAQERRERHWVVVATAHPAKFDDIVEPLIGRSLEIPGPLARLLALPSRFRELEAGHEQFKSVLMSG